MWYNGDMNGFWVKEGLREYVSNSYATLLASHLGLYGAKSDDTYRYYKGVIYILNTFKDKYPFAYDLLLKQGNCTTLINKYAQNLNISPFQARRAIYKQYQVLIKSLFKYEQRYFDKYILFD